MNHLKHFLQILLVTFLFGATCKQSGSGKQVPEKPHPASLGFVGDLSDVKTRTTGGMVLMGGGKDVDAAFQWMIARSGGGNAVVIRASGTAAYNPYIMGLGKLQSVETLLINSREIAEDENVARVIRNAELLWIAGGDQSNYMKYWRGTKTGKALNYLLTVKKVPFGGTSAGCAILGHLYYSGENGSVTSDSALADPYHKNVTLYKDDFLKAPFLDNLVTDQHYVTRSRQGRNIAFLSRFIKDWKVFPKGISIDERTAVCVDEKGMATVIGSSKAYFLSTDSKKPPEVCEAGKPLQWVAGQKAIKVYEVQGAVEGNGSFDVRNFNTLMATGGNWQWWWVTNGIFHREGPGK